MTDLFQAPLPEISLVAAFVAGVVSFISPCVLPLVPSYVTFITGVSFDELTAEKQTARVRRLTILHSLAFILGFSLVFISLGASATAIGHFLARRLPLLGRIAGVIIILFGLHTMGVLRIDWLYQEKRAQTQRKPAGFVGAMLVGIAFAFGWTPCIGPILAGILAIAATRSGVGEGVRLLAAYSLGLAVPFFATAIAINRFFGAMSRIRRHYHAIELVSGSLLVVIGVLIFTNRFTVIAQWLTPYLPVY